MKKLSKSQAEALKEVALHGGVFVRWQGGFWTWRGCPCIGKRSDQHGYYEVPTWSAATNTVRSLERLGMVERVNEFPEEWRDSRIITAAGLASTKEEAATSQRGREIIAMVETLHDLLKPMSPDERLVVFGDIMEGYCDRCGSEIPEHGCTCMRDE